MYTTSRNFGEVDISVRATPLRILWDLHPSLRSTHTCLSRHITPSDSLFVWLLTVADSHFLMTGGRFLWFWT